MKLLAPEITKNLSATLLELDQAVSQWENLISQDKSTLPPIALTNEKELSELPEKTRRLLSNLRSQLDELSK